MKNVSASVIIPLRIEHKSLHTYYENFRHSLHCVCNLNTSNDMFSIQNEVLVVDFGSSIDYSKQIKRLCSKYLVCKYIKRSSPVWSRSRALNTGIRSSLCEYICVVDADVIVNKSYILDHLQYQYSNNADFTVCEVYDAPKGAERVSNYDTYGKYIMKVRRGGHGHIFIKKEFLENIGLYDEEYYHWGAEDNDVVMRLRRYGYKFSVLDTVHPVHLWHKSYISLIGSVGKGKEAKAQRIKNRTRYLKKKNEKI